VVCAVVNSSKRVSARGLACGIWARIALPLPAVDLWHELMVLMSGAFAAVGTCVCVCVCVYVGGFLGHLPAESAAICFLPPIQLVKLGSCTHWVGAVQHDMRHVKNLPHGEGTGAVGVGSLARCCCVILGC
jgi:hypothetical protein